MHDDKCNAFFEASFFIYKEVKDHYVKTIEGLLDESKSLNSLYLLEAFVYRSEISVIAALLTSLMYLSGFYRLQPNQPNLNGVVLILNLLDQCVRERKIIPHLYWNKRHELKMEGSNVRFYVPIFAGSMQAWKYEEDMPMPGSLVPQLVMKNNKVPFFANYIDGRIQLTMKTPESVTQQKPEILEFIRNTTPEEFNSQETPNLDEPLLNDLATIIN